MAFCRDTVTCSNRFNIITNRVCPISACLASTGGALYVSSQVLRRRWGLHNRMNTKKMCGCIWWYNTSGCNTEFLCGCILIHIYLLFLRSVSSHRRWTQTLQRSTDWHCAFDMFNTARSFTHESNTCKIGWLVFLNLGLIDLLSCTLLTVILLSHHLLVGCTTPESSCRRNFTNAARVRQYYRPIAPSTECVTFDLDGLCLVSFHSLSVFECVCCFVLLNWYWGIVTVPGSIHYGIRPGVAGSSPQWLRERFSNILVLMN